MARALLRLLQLSLVQLVTAAALLAQDPPSPSPQSEISPAAIQRQLDDVTANDSLPAELKATIADTLRRALESAKRAEAHRASLEKYATAKATAADRLQARQADLTALEQVQPGPQRQDLTLTDLEQGFSAAQQALTQAQQRVVELDQQAAQRGERRTAIPPRVAEQQKRLDALPASLPEVAEVDARLRSAQRIGLATERLELQNELACLQAELQTYDAESELLRAERNLAARRVTTAKTNADAWQVPLQAARAAAARRAEEEARLAQLLADPRVAKLARSNAELAAEVASLAHKRDAAERSKVQLTADLAQLQQDFEETKKRAELVGKLVGTTEAIGTLLRQRRLQLTDTARKYQVETRGRVGDVAAAQLQGLEYDERLRRLVEDPDAWLQAQVSADEGAAELPPDVLTEARRLRDARRDLLTQLTSGYDALLQTQIDLTSVENQLGGLISTYRTFVTERVLSIRSSKPIWNFDLPASGRAIAWFTSVAHWRELLVATDLALRQPIWPMLVIALVMLVLAMSRQFVGRLQKHGETAARGTTVNYLPTALAALDTVLLSLPAPALLLLAGYLLEGDATATDFVKAIAAGLQRCGWSLLPIAVLRQVLRPRGLAEAHFQWQTTTLARLRSIVPLLLFAAVPFAFALGVVEATGDDSWLGSLGAAMLAGEISLILVAFWRMLHPTTGILGTTLPGATGTLHRFRRLWFLLGVGTPVALLAMVALGYDYTALQLTRRMLATFGAVLGAVLLQAMILRSLVLERRRLQIKRMKERLEAAKSGDTGSPESPKIEQVDPGSLARQTQTLVRWSVAVAAAIGVFQIWVDVLPALGILDRVAMWSTLDLDGKPAVITLADVCKSAFVLAAAAAAARNLPALLELFVLQRLRMQPGERHAVTTLARYGIVVVGLVLAFSTIGIGWSKVQWLVAAVSVGLGFGLQEIFANFVSGLILLIERPIRVGDIVQIGSTTGRVTRIQIRATTIQDWERKELVVPNREFVTGHFVNWTLADGVVRRTIKVGIAYGSDTAKALELLLQMAKRNPVVLPEPAPEAIFVGFGDSTLDLELRIFVDQTTLDLKDISRLLVAIDLAFREAGIEIAFPQRDVHLDLSAATIELLQRNPDHIGRS